MPIIRRMSQTAGAHDDSDQTNTSLTICLRHVAVGVIKSEMKRWFVVFVHHNIRLLYWCSRTATYSDDVRASTVSVTERARTSARRKQKTCSRNYNLFEYKWKTPSMLSRVNPAVRNDWSWSMLIRAEKSNRYHVTITERNNLHHSSAFSVTEVSVLHSNISLYLH